MAGLYSHTIRATGLTLTAAIYNADHQNHIDNFVPSQMDDYSENVTQMQAVTSPGTVGSESLATTMAGELERLRYQLKALTRGAQWYSAPWVGGWELVETLTASASSELDFETGLSSTDADEFMIVLNNLLLSNDAAHLHLRVKEGGSYREGASDYSWTFGVLSLSPGATSGNVTYGSSNGGTTEIRVVSSADSVVPIQGQILVNKPGSPGYKFIRYSLATGESGGTSHRRIDGFGLYLPNTNAWTGIRLLPSAGNLTSGSASLYRLRKS